MLGQVTRGILIGVIGGLLGACGSGGSEAKQDAARPSRQDAAVVPVAVDGGGVCDEDAMGEDYCIINSPGGNGSAVTRQNPVNYNTCK
jgi:hypothetical protein